VTWPPCEIRVMLHDTEPSTEMYRTAEPVARSRDEHVPVLDKAPDTRSYACSADCNKRDALF
jgi:hypothetical protein